MRGPSDDDAAVFHAAAEAAARRPRPRSASSYGRRRLQRSPSPLRRHGKRALATRKSADRGRFEPLASCATLTVHDVEQETAELLRFVTGAADAATAAATKSPPLSLLPPSSSSPLTPSSLLSASRRPRRRRGSVRSRLYSSIEKSRRRDLRAGLSSSSSSSPPDASPGSGRAGGGASGGHWRVHVVVSDDSSLDKAERLLDALTYHRRVRLLASEGRDPIARLGTLVAALDPAETGTLAVKDMAVALDEADGSPWWWEPAAGDSVRLPAWREALEPPRGSSHIEMLYDALRGLGVLVAEEPDNALPDPLGTRPQPTPGPATAAVGVPGVGGVTVAADAKTAIGNREDNGDADGERRGRLELDQRSGHVSAEGGAAAAAAPRSIEDALVDYDEVLHYVRTRALLPPPADAGLPVRTERSAPSFYSSRPHANAEAAEAEACSDGFGEDGYSDRRGEDYQQQPPQCSYSPGSAQDQGQSSSSPASPCTPDRPRQRRRRSSLRAGAASGSGDSGVSGGASGGASGGSSGRRRRRRRRSSISARRAADIEVLAADDDVIRTVRDLQRVARGWVSRRGVQPRLAAFTSRRQRSSRRIQAQFRGHRGRQRVRAKQTGRAATRIQAVHRGRVGRRRYELKREHSQKEVAAVRVQRVVRGHQARGVNQPNRLVLRKRASTSSGVKRGKTLTEMEHRCARLERKWEEDRKLLRDLTAGAKAAATDGGTAAAAAAAAGGGRSAESTDTTSTAADAQEALKVYERVIARGNDIVELQQSLMSRRRLEGQPQRAPTTATATAAAATATAATANTGAAASSSSSSASTSASLRTAATASATARGAPQIRDTTTRQRRGEAAVAIQRIYRGHAARKKVKTVGNSAQQMPQSRAESWKELESWYESWDANHGGNANGGLDDDEEFAYGGGLEDSDVPAPGVSSGSEGVHSRVASPAPVGPRPVSKARDYAAGGDGGGNGVAKSAAITATTAAAATVTKKKGGKAKSRAAPTAATATATAEIRSSPLSNDGGSPATGRARLQVDVHAPLVNEADDGLLLTLSPSPAPKSGSKSWEHGDAQRGEEEEEEEDSSDAFERELWNDIEGGLLDDDAGDDGDVVGRGIEEDDPGEESGQTEPALASPPRRVPAIVVRSPAAARAPSRQALRPPSSPNRAGNNHAWGVVVARERSSPKSTVVNGSVAVGTEVKVLWRGAGGSKVWHRGAVMAQSPAKGQLVSYDDGVAQWHDLSKACTVVISTTGAKRGDARGDAAPRAPPTPPAAPTPLAGRRGLAHPAVPMSPATVERVLNVGTSDSPPRTLLRTSSARAAVTSSSASSSSRPSPAASPTSGIRRTASARDIRGIRDDHHEAVQHRSDDQERLAHRAIMRVASGRYNQALSLYEKLVDLHKLDEAKQRKGRNGRDSGIGYAQTLQEMAEVYVGKKDYAHAMPLLQQSMDLLVASGHASSLGAARTQHEIALIHLVQGRLDSAYEVFSRVLEIQSDRLGAGHLDCARTLCNLSSVHHARGEFSRAHDRINEAKAIYKEQLGEAHPEFARTLRLHGKILGAQGRIDEAIDMVTKARGIQHSCLGHKHPDITATSQVIRALVALRKQGQG